MGKANPPSSALKVSGQAIDTISWRATPNAPFAPCDHFRASSPVYASQTSKEGETYRQHHHATLLRAARRTPLRTPFQAHPSTSFTIDYIQVSVIPRRRRVTYPATALARVALGYCVPGGVHQSFALRQFRVSRAPLRFENLEGKTHTNRRSWLEALVRTRGRRLPHRCIQACCRLRHLRVSPGRIGSTFSNNRGEGAALGGITR